MWAIIFPALYWVPLFMETTTLYTVIPEFKFFGTHLAFSVMHTLGVIPPYSNSYHKG